MFSAQLVPQIAALLAKHHFGKTDIDAFIVVSGPGSFTGLRVGLAAIKALAEILKKPIAPVSLLEVLAIQSRLPGKVVALLDAGRGDTYFGAYEIAGESVQVFREQLMSKTEFLSAARGSTVVTPTRPWLRRRAGPVFPPFRSNLRARRQLLAWAYESCKLVRLSPPSSWKRTTCGAPMPRCL